MAELTDEQLLKLAAIDGYDNIEPGEYEAPNERALEVYGSELVASMRAAIAAERRIRPQPVPVATPGEQYHEDMGPVLWWRFPIEEPPYVGTPNDSDWPGYHTHYTPVAIPTEPTTTETNG